MRLPRLRTSSIFLLLLLASLTHLASVARAQEGDEAYLVRHVAIDATAESALAAKQAAIRTGQRQAFDRLLRRLALAAEHERLPSSADLDLSEMVASFGLADEKTSEVRYLARLTVQFRRSAVQRLLRGSDIQFSEARARPTLVLPVLEADGRRQLFAEDNAWLAAWSDLELPFGALLPLTIPLGDLGDISALNADTALAAGGVERFAPLLQRYDCASAAVVHATLLPGTNPAGRLNVVVYRHGPAGEGTLVTAYDAGAEETVDGLMQRAARATADQLEDDWKRRTVLRFGDEASLSARVPYQGLDGWLEIRRRLAAVPNIEKVEISAISTLDAQVTVHYLGQAPQLNTALAAHDLRLEERQGYWYLVRTDVAAEPPAGNVNPAESGDAAPAPSSPSLSPAPPATGTSGRAPANALPNAPAKTSE